MLIAAMGLAACAHQGPATPRELTVEASSGHRKVRIAEGPAEVIEARCTGAHGFVFLGEGRAGGDGDCDQPELEDGKVAQPAELLPSGTSYGIPFTIPAGKVGCLGVQATAVCTVRWRASAP
jgi:hypothetical protein